MATAQDHVAGSAERRAVLAGARAHDFTAFEQRMLTLYESVLEDVSIEDATALLDVGCGAGFFLRLAAQRGATVTGIEPAAGLVAIARERLPDAEVTHGGVGSLPYDDEAFSVVTCFDSFQDTFDSVQALREARRVARPHAAVVLATWARAEHCEAAAYLTAIDGLRPPRSPGAREPFALSGDGALEDFAASGGLSPVARRDVPGVWSFIDEPSTLRALRSTAAAVEASAHAGDDEVTEAVLAAIAPYRLSDGGYRIENRFTYLLARA